MPSADEDSSPVFLPGPAIPRRLVLVSGVKGKCKIRKKLSKDLTGAVASDFFGDAYLFQLSLLSDGARGFACHSSRCISRGMKPSSRTCSIWKNRCSSPSATS